MVGTTNTHLIHVRLEGISSTNTHLRERHQHVKLEGKYRPCEEDNEDSVSRVLEVGDLHLAGTELDPPAYVGVDGRDLEAHTLPVGALDVLGEEGDGRVVSELVRSRGGVLNRERCLKRSSQGKGLGE